MVGAPAMALPRWGVRRRCISPTTTPQRVVSEKCGNTATEPLLCLPTVHASWSTQICKLRVCHSFATFHFPPKINKKNKGESVFLFSSVLLQMQRAPFLTPHAIHSGTSQDAGRAQSKVSVSAGVPRIQEVEPFIHSLNLSVYSSTY